MEARTTYALPTPDPALVCRDAGPDRCATCGLEEAGTRVAPASGAETVQGLPKTARPLAHAPCLGVLASVAFHVLALLAAIGMGAFSLENAQVSRLQVVAEISLNGLAGPGGSGGDGRMPGGGNGSAAVSEQSPAPSPEPSQAAAAQPAAATEPEPAEQALARPAAPPEPQPVPDPRLPEPKKEAKPKPKPPVRPRPAKPSDRASSAVAPAAAPTAANASQGAELGQGLKGDGSGLGPSQGPGSAGAGGSGPGGGGGGDYVGQFGQGDGPTFRHRCLPRYPDEARSGNQEGRVVLRLFIDAGGILRDVEVLEHSGLDFVAEAVRAIRASSFFPAKRQGQPVPCRAVLAIRFKLG